MPAPRPIDSPDYLAAQIDCLRALIVAMAGMTVRREEFRREGLAALERLRIATLNMPTHDARLKAIDDAEAWLRCLAE